MEEELQQLQELEKAARGAIRDGVPIDILNSDIAARTGGSIESFLALTKVIREGFAEVDRDKTSGISAAIQGFGQSASFGFSDELSGLVGGVRAALPGDPRSFGEGFRESTEFARESLAQAQADRPKTFLAGSLAGALAGGGGAALGVRAARGGVALGRGGLAAVLAGEGGLAGVGAGEGLTGRIASGAGGAALGAAAGEAGRAGLAIARGLGRGTKALRTFTPKTRIGREPFKTGRQAADRVISETGILPRPPAGAADELVEAFDKGRRFFKRSPAEIETAIRRSPAPDRLRDGLGEALADDIARAGNPKAAVKSIVAPANMERLRLVFGDDKAFGAFKKEILAAAQLGNDAEVLAKIGKILRTFAFIGAAGGLATALTQFGQ